MVVNNNGTLERWLYQLLITEYGFYAEKYTHINIDIYKSRTTMAKAAFITKKVIFTSKLDLNLRNKQQSATFEALLCMVMKIGHFGKLIRNTWKVSKCGVGEGWRRSVG